MKLFLIYFLVLFTALNAFETDKLYGKSLEFHKEYLKDDYITAQQVKHHDFGYNNASISGIVLAVISAVVFLSLVGYMCAGCSESTYTDHAYTGTTVITTNRPAVYTVPAAPAIITVPTYYPDHHHSHHTTVNFSNTHIDSGLAGTNFRSDNFGSGLGGTDFRSGDNYGSGLGGTDFRSDDNNFNSGFGGTDFRGNDDNFGSGLGGTDFRSDDNYGGDTSFR